MAKHEYMVEPIIMDYKCPLCNSNVYTENDPSVDYTLGEYCDNENCDWFTNQFISYDDMVG